MSSEELSQHRRLSRPELFMAVASLYGARSSCPRADVGVVAVLDGRIVATGYCGAPHGMPHCLDVGCEIVNGRCERSVHAEANMVAWAARVGTSLKGTTVYCTWSPCYACAKLLANAGIVAMYWNHTYSDRRGIDLLSALNIRAEAWNDAQG